MPYFQNPFNQEFRGNWILGDRQYTVNFVIKGNINSPTLMACWNVEPYDFSAANTLTIRFAIDPTLKQFGTMSINVAGAVPAATLAAEVATALNADNLFSGLFVAGFEPYNHKLSGQNGNIVTIRSRRPNTDIRAFVVNSGAETKLQFNQKAPIAEMPTYFRRHTVDSAVQYDDGVATLVELDPGGNAYESDLISLSGFNPAVIRDDWQLLDGRSGLFPFKKLTYDGSNRLETIIEYPAGAGVGDLATLTKYQYSGAATNPNVVTVIPITLASGDLVTP